LLGLVILTGLLNLMTGLLQWLVSPSGLVSVFILANLSLCVFTASCPPVAIVRRLCARAGYSFG
jgi:hypothetical protein